MKKINKKDKKIVIFVILGIFAVVFGMMFNLSQAFTSSDFTMTNMEVSGDNIVMSPYSETFNNPRVGNNRIIRWYTGGSSLETATKPTITKFCELQGYAYFSSYTGSSSFGSQTMVIWNGNQFVEYSDRNHGISSATCVSDSELFSTGGFVTTNPITTAERYNYFELEYTSNSGTDKPYIVIGTEKHYFTNGKLSTDTILSGTDIWIGAESESTSTSISKDFVLSAAFVEGGSSSAEGLDSAEVLSVLSASSNDVVSKAKDTPPVILIIGVVLILMLLFLGSKGGKKKK